MNAIHLGEKFNNECFPFLPPYISPMLLEKKSKICASVDTSINLKRGGGRNNNISKSKTG